MLLLNPKHHTREYPDARSREIMLKTIDFFERKGKRKLKARGDSALSPSWDGTSESEAIDRAGPAPLPRRRAAPSYSPVPLHSGARSGCGTPSAGPRVSYKEIADRPDRDARPGPDREGPGHRRAP